MNDVAVRQAPGWWASLVRAECDTCGWVGPTRNVYEARDARLLKIDVGGHRCRVTTEALLGVEP